MKTRTITYIDSNLLNTQDSFIVKPTTIKATGFVIEETGEYITLARELIEGEYRGQVAIPKVAIVKRRKK